MVDTDLSKGIQRAISFYALICAFIILIFTLLIFFILFDREPLLMFILSVLFGFICNSIFAILLFKKTNKKDNLFIIGEYFLLSVQFVTIIYLAIAYFFISKRYLFLFYMPAVGSIMAVIIPLFYKKRKVY